MNGAVPYCTTIKILFRVLSFLDEYNNNFIIWDVIGRTCVEKHTTVHTFFTFLRLEKSSFSLRKYSTVLVRTKYLFFDDVEIF